MRFFFRTTAALVAISCAFGCSGCTLLGAGIGAAISRPSEQSVPAQIQAVPRGSTVSVVYFRPYDERGGGHLMLDGTFRGIDNGRAIIERGDNAYWIPVSRIEDTRAHPPTASYVTEGAIVGAVIDVALVLLVLSSIPKNGGD